MPIEAIEPRRLYRQVADHLRDLIDRGEYKVGERLPTERELSEKLGISRPTVREALIALEVEHRVRIRVGSGIYVTEPPAQSPILVGPAEGPFELLRARAFIESAIAAEAATLVTQADINAMDHLLDAMERSSDAGTKAMVGLDRQFHQTIASIVGNGIILRFAGDLFDQRINPYFQRLSGHFETADTWRAAVDEHRAIRDAIASRDPGAASAAMRHHLQQSQHRFSTSFEEEAASPG
ncbi:GntR family transcriptional regulator [Skermanella stibiiresistens SB22]|uniref:GntR family transcriptional regulator n=1 Tax=Skermanella stibiiresistens SB22 TaxID=1385369 RepID=W9GTM0_9PROT|nr:FadR/GntR family transcriptional regulator [Skermanella stibiiresistens]EWY37230.1 GntR family transcriptional regulator [Skermanella stibiiresistens SB22]